MKFLLVTPEALASSCRDDMSSSHVFGRSYSNDVYISSRLIQGFETTDVSRCPKKVAVDYTKVTYHDTRLPSHHLLQHPRRLPTR